MVIPCLCSFTVPSSPFSEPPANKKRTRTLSHRELGSSTNCMVEITGIEPVTSCMPCKRSPEPRTHAPPHKGAGMIDIRRYNALFRERRILTQKQLCCLNEFY